MTPILDLIGVGIGPSNLSIAALSATKTQLSTQFFEQKPQFSWHPGMLLKEAKMQTSFVKDLVTCVDPTSPYSFLNYLVTQGKIYPFLASGQSTLSRLEFTDYMSWVANQLPNTQFNAPIEDIQYDKGQFVVIHEGQEYLSRHLVIGTGIQPMIPTCAKPFIGSNCFHAGEMATIQPNLTNKRVAIVGGGQSGADIFQHVFDGIYGAPSRIDWWSRRSNIEALDEGCFTDEYFMPDYVNRFYHLHSPVKTQEVQRQKLTSDGITNECLQGLYQRLYQDKFVRQTPAWWSINPSQKLINMQHNNSVYHLTYEHTLTGKKHTAEADIVILCTGFKRCLPNCLSEVLPHLKIDANARIELGENFNAKWKKACENEVYIVNAGTYSHGIAEPQLSLIAWRAARIINHLFGADLYRIPESPNIVNWLLPLKTNCPQNQANSRIYSSDELTSFN
ncbi:lysine N(6)-hydroxylase/L-ornithine N(5)-oxygenase family protein [Alteromonas sp. a30]|uniref:lysine N(6)-hydroxylase/L-ornithine N(5)-oxygenase family protein n=1 Tax=Alteromonas sp. a30 TaxID=2730917 RepID=UPI00227FFB64|nr:SidA/IucD/PvdA family monooxygenase [Alteromonas sp. a30]